MAANSGPLNFAECLELEFSDNSSTETASSSQLDCSEPSDIEEEVEIIRTLKNTVPEDPLSNTSYLSNTGTEDITCRHETNNKDSYTCTCCDHQSRDQLELIKHKAACEGNINLDQNCEHQRSCSILQQSQNEDQVEKHQKPPLIRVKPEFRLNPQHKSTELMPTDTLVIDCNSFVKRLPYQGDLLNLLKLQTENNNGIKAKKNSQKSSKINSIYKKISYKKIEFPDAAVMVLESDPNRTLKLVQIVDVEPSIKSKRFSSVKSSFDAKNKIAVPKKQPSFLPKSQKEIVEKKLTVSRSERPLTKRASKRPRKRRRAVNKVGLKSNLKKNIKAEIVSPKTTCGESSLLPNFVEVDINKILHSEALSQKPSLRTKAIAKRPHTTKYPESKFNLMRDDILLKIREELDSHLKADHNYHKIDFFQKLGVSRIIASRVKSFKLLQHLREKLGSYSPDNGIRYPELQIAFSLMYQLEEIHENDVKQENPTIREKLKPTGKSNNEIRLIEKIQKEKRKLDFNLSLNEVSLSNIESQEVRPPELQTNTYSSWYEDKTSFGDQIIAIE